MSTVKTTNLQHPSSGSANITLAADGSVVLPAGFTGGVGSNVVSTTKTDTFTANLAQGASTPVTGLSVTITPTSATSKILVLCQITGGKAGFPQYAALRADSTLIAVGASAGSRQQVSTGFGQDGSGGPDGTYMMALHSPATTSAVVYDVVVSHGTPGTDFVGINRSETDADATNVGRTSSTITAIEVAA